MNKIKHILFIFLMLLMASCAKDEAIPMGSLKINTQVTNITSTSVLMEFNLPTDADQLQLEYVFLYDKNGNPVNLDVNYGDFTYVRIENGKFCIIENLQPNTEYTYKIGVYEEHKRSINNGGDGLIKLYDSSYSFTTKTPSGTESYLNASVKTEFLTSSSALLKVIINKDLEIKNIYYEDIFVSESENGVNPIFPQDKPSINYNEVSVFFENLKPDTRYYLFVKGSFNCPFLVDGYEFNYVFENISLQLNVNSFKTLTESEYSEYAIGEIQLKEIFNSESYYIGILQFKQNLVLEAESEVFISKSKDGTNTVASFTTDYGHNEELCIYSYNLEPSTEYYVFIKGNFFYNDYPYTYIRNANLYISSFVTSDSWNTDMSLDMVTSVIQDNGYNLNFDFDKRLLIQDAEVEIDGMLWCSPLYRRANGCIRGGLYGVDNVIPGEYTVKSLICDITYYVTDDGYACIFPFPLYYNPKFDFTSVSKVSDAEDGKSSVTYTREISDKTTLGCGFKYIY